MGEISLDCVASLAGAHLAFPELLAQGLEPHAVEEVRVMVWEDTRILGVSVLLLVLTTLPAGSLAHAQNFGYDPNLRLDWAVAQGRKGPEIAGYLYNLRDGYWAANVRIQVESLDASGNVIGSRLGSVFGQVPPSNRSYFEIPVPISGAASYRVTVRTLDWRGHGGGGM